MSIRRNARLRTLREAGTMSETTVQEDLLFGFFAVQLGYVSSQMVDAALAQRNRDGSGFLSDILHQQGSLTLQQQDELLEQVGAHLARHDGDATVSLMVLRSSAEQAREVLDALGPLPVSSQDGAVSELTTTNVGITQTWNRERGGIDEAGRFRVLRPHAHGGIGQVSVALDVELNREVALKEIRPERADDLESRARFFLEAEVTGRLEHPGIVPVYALGVSQEGRPFYVMRFVRGESLKEAVTRHYKGGPDSQPGETALAVRRLLGRFLDACNAVAYAHSRGVIHRDLKPSNILLGPYGETLVVDWGLAKVIGRGEGPAKESETFEQTIRPASGSGSSETLAGSAMGTPAYMSPEQADGRIDLLGPACDVYSLGATLYSILSGRAPFEDRDVLTVLRKVRRGDFPRLREIATRVDRALEAVCLKAMSNRAADRYASVHELVEDVEHWLADEPVKAYREGWSRRLSRWTRRHRSWALA